MSSFVFRCLRLTMGYVPHHGDYCISNSLHFQYAYDKLNLKTESNNMYTKLQKTPQIKQIKLMYIDYQ